MPRCPARLYAAFVRSPHAAADIKSIDTSAAKAIKGVVAVLTGADLKDFHGSISQHPPLPGRGGAKLIMPFRPSLAADRVNHIGEAVAVVIGDFGGSTGRRRSGRSRLWTWEPIVDCKAAVAKGVPQVHPEAPGNIAVNWPGLAPDPEANAKEVERIFASAKHVAKVSLFHNRLNVASMEPRGATANYDAAADLFNLRVCSQGARAMRDSMAAVMKIGNDKIRVTTEEVGGAFGLKTGPYPEYLAILAAAKKIGRPVYWMCSRSEAFLTDNHARDAYSDVELALDEKGKFLALRIRHIGAMGAYIGAVGANIQTINMMRCLPGMYDIRHIDAQTRCVFTNTVVTAPYRGAGRPEASYCLERVVDEAARITGIDPIKLRKRNLISKRAMPYKTAVGTTYDFGDFAAVIDQGLALADMEGFKARKKELKKKGLLRGLGVCFVLEHSGGAPIEGLMVKFPGGNNLDLTLNVQSTGQGHATIFPRLVAERLGIKFEEIKHHHGDSRHEVAGYASVGSRSAMTVGHSMVKTIEAIVAKGKKVAASVLEAGEGDIEYANGAFNVVGTDRKISLFDTAAKAAEMTEQGRHRGKPRHQAADRDAAHLPERLPRRRGGGRPGHRQAHAGELHRRGRLRQRARSHDRRGPNSRRGDLRRRPGDDGKHRRKIPADSSCPARSWTTRCRARTTCRRSRKVSARSRRPPTRLASRVRGKPAPPLRSPR